MSDEEAALGGLGEAENSPSGPTASDATALDSLRSLKIVVVASSGLVLLGSLLTWASAGVGPFSVSVAGTSNGGDGIATLLLALVAAGAIGFGIWRPRIWMAVLSLASLGVAGVIAITDAIRIWTFTGPPSQLISVSAEVGIGLWLCMIGAVAGFGFSIVILRRGAGEETGVGEIKLGDRTVQGNRVIYPAIAVVAIVILLIVHPWSSFSSSPSASGSSLGDSSSSSSGSSGFTMPTTTTSPPPQRLAIGETAKFATTTDGLDAMTVSAIYPNVPLDSGDTPSSGKQFDVIDVQQCAASSANDASATTYGVRLLLDNGAQVEDSASFGNPQVPQLASITNLDSAESVAPGACVRGYILFEVPVGATVTSVQMTAEPEDFGDSQIITWKVG